MEVTRKRWWNTKEIEKVRYRDKKSLKREFHYFYDRLRSTLYGFYKIFNLYGESIFLPLLAWTPLIIFIFTLVRIQQDPYNSVKDGPWLEWVYNKFLDSLFAYFQFPRKFDDFWGTVERIVSAPILAIVIKSFALTKRFETTVR
jgi:hypothetical protein